MIQSCWVEGRRNCLDLRAASCSLVAHQVPYGRLCQDQLRWLAADRDEDQLLHQESTLLRDLSASAQATHDADLPSMNLYQIGLAHETVVHQLNQCFPCYRLPNIDLNGCSSY